MKSRELCSFETATTTWRLGQLSNDLKKERRQKKKSRVYVISEFQKNVAECWTRVDDEFRSNEVATVRYIRNQSSK